MTSKHSPFLLAVVGIAMSLSSDRALAEDGNAVVQPPSNSTISDSLIPGNPVVSSEDVLGQGQSLDNGSHLMAGTQLDQVLGLYPPRCGHVIDLLISNHIRRHRGYGVSGVPAPGLPHILRGPRPGDLELIAVHLATEGDAEQGPVYQVDFRNLSKIAIGHFRISVVGVLGQIEVTSPTATVNISRVEAGQAASVRIQLPAAAMVMGSTDQRPMPFDKLVVAIDSFDELIECNELNNVAILQRDAISPLVIEAPAASPAIVAPDTEAKPLPIPGDTTPPSALDEIDLDKLDFGDADRDAVQTE